MVPQMPGGRFLLIWQDNLLHGVVGRREIDWIAPGPSITPGSAPPPRLGPGKVFRILWHLLARHYRMVAIPVARPDWSYDDTNTKRRLRRAAAAILRNGPARTTIRRVLLGHQPLIVLDRYCRPDPVPEYLDLLAPDLYLKTQLREADAHTDQRVELLPYWIHCDRYPAPEGVVKDIDLFFGACLNSEPRRHALAELRKLEADGHRVCIQEARLPLPEYFAMLARSYLVVSPQGYGYHCFRHYEAMLAGSVPVINEAPGAVAGDLQNGHNCIIYGGENGGLAKAAATALADRESLATQGSRLRGWVMKEHSAQATGRYLLSALDRVSRLRQSEAVIGPVPGQKS